jgi:hypothetical protein
MGGIWGSSTPIRPGLYLNFETTGTDAVPAGNSGIVGLPITADWGPVGEFVEISSDAQYRSVFGPNNYGKSYLVQEAFRGGALRVLAYRMADPTQVAASELDLTDDAATYAVVETTTGGVGQDEVQTLSSTVPAVGGDFTLSFTGTVAAPIATQTTAAIPYNASAAAVQAALEALPGIDPGDVTCAGGPLPGSPITITFGATYTEEDMNLLVVNSAGLLGGDTILNLTAKYAGTRGDSLRVVIRPNPLNNARKDVQVYEGAELREKYTYNATDHAALVAQINDPTDGSTLVVATLNAAHPEYPGPYTVELADMLTGTYLTGGDNGDAGLTVADYTDPLGVFDMFERRGGFDVFTLPDESDPGLISSLIQWTESLNEEGTYVMAVVGGDSDELLGTAVTRSDSADSEWLVNVGRTDLKVAYPDGTTVVRRTAAMTPRVAGLIAAAGINRAITFADLSTVDSPVEVVTPLTKEEIEEAITSGVIVFTKRGPRVVVEDGVTTFTSYTTEKDATFGSIKSVRTMQQIGRDFNEIVESGFIGVTNNDTATRNALISAVKRYLADLEGRGALIRGSQVLIDERFINTGDTVHLLLLVQFGRELKRVLMTLRAPILT